MTRLVLIIVKEFSLVGRRGPRPPSGIINETQFFFILRVSRSIFKMFPSPQIGPRGSFGGHFECTPMFKKKHRYDQKAPICTKNILRCLFLLTWTYLVQFLQKKMFGQNPRWPPPGILNTWEYHIRGSVSLKSGCKSYLSAYSDQITIYMGQNNSFMQIQDGRRQPHWQDFQEIVFKLSLVTYTDVICHFHITLAL